MSADRELPYIEMVGSLGKLVWGDNEGDFLDLIPLEVSLDELENGARRLGREVIESPNFGGRLCIIRRSDIPDRHLMLLGFPEADNRESTWAVEPNFTLNSKVVLGY